MSDEKPKKSAVFIVQVVMSSQNQTLGSQEIGDTQVLVDFKHKKETRQRIAAIRMKFKKPIYKDALNFYGIYLCNESQTKSMQESIVEANKELQEIDKSLHASVVFIPINIHEVERGELYGQVIAAIRYRILSDVIGKIEDKAGQLNKQSKDAMARMIKRLKTVNVLNDPEIDNRLDEILERILKEDVEVVRKDLKAEMNITSSRIGFIQF